MLPKFYPKFYKQIDGCPMGSPISVAMTGIFMNILERDVIKPPLQILYKWYVDDIYVRRKPNFEDKLFNDFNNYHENIKFTVENAPKKFLDTQIFFENSTINTKVVQGRQIIISAITMDNSFSTHHRNLQKLAIEIFKVKNNLSKFHEYYVSIITESIQLT